MGSGDDKRHSRSTARFERDALAKLTQESIGASGASGELDALELEPASDRDASQELLPATSRAPTLHDPMTMALLAEVARNSKTVDFDPDRIDQLIEDAEHADAPPSHVHVQRPKR